jgi:hypothetical protein
MRADSSLIFRVVGVSGPSRRCALLSAVDRIE